jgi:DHA2 family multidrug resistance protein
LCIEKAGVRAKARETTMGSAPSNPAYRPAINPWVIAITVTFATFMELLDMAIANVALPHIAGGLAVLVCL